MAKYAVLKASDMSLVTVCNNKKELKEYLTEDFVVVTKATFVPDEQYETFAQLCGEEVAVAEGKPARAPRAPRTTLPTEGGYEILREFSVISEEHPKFPIWEAISNNRTIEQARAACPAENPKRRTSGVYTFLSEFRYFIRAGYIKLVDD
jgi:hypothetical protein